MPDIVVPSGGTTDDQTPELRIMLNDPIWPGSEVRVRRNGLDVGAATQLSPTEFAFVDNVTDGSFEYRAEVVRQGMAKQSVPYFVQVSTPIVEDPAPVIVSINDDDMDVVLPTPVISGIIGEAVVVPPAALAAPPLLPGTAPGVVLGAGIHWRRIVLTQPVTDFQVDTMQGAADTVIGLFSSAGSLVAQDDDSGGENGGNSLTSHIALATLAAGTYYLAVIGYQGAFSSGFGVHQLTEPPTDYPDEFILNLAYNTGGA